MRRVSHIAALVISGFLMFSCAKQNSSGPTGGPLDETPPKVVEAVPPDKSINFAEKEFKITFDEYFVLDNITQKLMISPPFDKKPEITSRGKTMSVTFEEELRDSITYTFYFMDAVKDLNEGNPIENFQYVFSTGPTLDSLSVTGTIYNANTLDSGEEIFVVLYTNLNDTAPATMLPEYITRAGTDGKFRIDNIAEGEYAIYGLVDLNNNKYYDLPDETFAFIDSTITLSGTNNYIPEMPDSLATAADSARYLSIPGKEYSLYHFQGANTQQYLTSTSRDEAYKLMYTFKQPLDSGQFDISFIDSIEVEYLMEMSAKKDSVIIWVLDSTAYKSQTLIIRADYPETDSTGAITIVTDTIRHRYSAPPPQRGRKQQKKTGLAVKHNISTSSGFKPGSDVLFTFVTPMQDTDTSLIDLFMVADTNLLPLEYSINRDSVSNKKFILKHPFIQDSTYLLRYDRGAFEDIFGMRSDSTGVRFKINNIDSYGTLTMKLSGFLGNIILQLIDSKDIMVKENYIELNDDVDIFYPLLDKGEYIVKAIFDLDGNGEWTGGDFSKKLQPEPVSFYPSVIDIKVQWDLIQEWEINKINFKPDEIRKETKPSNR